MKIMISYSLYTMSYFLIYMPINSHFQYNNNSITAIGTCTIRHSLLFLIKAFVIKSNINGISENKQIIIATIYPQPSSPGSFVNTNNPNPNTSKKVMISGEIIFLSLLILIH